MFLQKNLFPSTESYLCLSPISILKNNKYTVDTPDQRSGAQDCLLQQACDIIESVVHLFPGRGAAFAYFLSYFLIVEFTLQIGISSAQDFVLVAFS